MHPPKTAPSRTTFSAVLAITFFALLMQACVPGEIASSGGETFGSETAGDGDPAATGADESADGPTQAGEQACEGMLARSALGDVFCADGSCTGLWASCEFRSSVIMAGDLEGLTVLSHDEIWPCATGSADVDICVEVDSLGHLGCFWFAGAYAVAVAPACAVDGVDGWLPVGSGMMAREH